MTLSRWIEMIRSSKPFDLLGSLIIGCSTTDHKDGPLDFTIGMQTHLAKGIAELPVLTSTIRPAESRDRLFFAAFNVTTDVRRRGPVRRKVAENVLPKLGVRNESLSVETYMHEMGRSKFVISPEGNGVDCHRHYEALLFGAIPIVEDSPLVRKKYAGCPMIFTTQQYEDVASDPSRFERLYEEMASQTFDFSRLIFGAQSGPARRVIAENCAYWMQRMARDWFSRHRHLLFRPNRIVSAA